MGSTKPDKTQLTPREIEIQQLLASGMTRKEIAVKLGIACRTVGRHLDSIRARAQGTKEKHDYTRDIDRESM